MNIDTTINSVKVTFDLQAREADISKKLSINEKTAKRATQALRELNIIKRQGAINQVNGH